jgi:hypothetical protein
LAVVLCVYGVAMLWLDGLWAAFSVGYIFTASHSIQPNFEYFFDRLDGVWIDLPVVLQQKTQPLTGNFAVG